MSDAEPDRRIAADQANEIALAVVTQQWEWVMERGRDLVPLFDKCKMGLTITVVARAMGLRDKSALKHLLVARRLPPFKLFRNWCYVVQLVDRFSSTRETLGGWVEHRGLATSTYYDLINRSTARTWKEVQANGSVWARAKALEAWAVFL